MYSYATIVAMHKSSSMVFSIIIFYVHSTQEKMGKYLQIIFVPT